MSREKALDWIENDANLLDLHDQVAVVTGANTGTGKFVAHGLALRGARVILACRDMDKGIAAATEIADETGNDEVEVQPLDLADKTSIANAADEIRWNHPRVDILVNNAGLGLLENKTLAEEGFEYRGKKLEMQFAVNYLGHYALTGQLWPALARAPRARVVNVASNGHKFVQPNLEDINCERTPYRHLTAYSRSKLAQLQGTYALQRRLDVIDSPAIAVAAHPGIAMTDFMRNKRHLNTKSVRETLQFLRFAQSPAMGALPILYAAAGADVRGGAYYGPGGPLEITGLPRLTKPHPRALDTSIQDQLWALSQEATGCYYPVPQHGL